MTTVDKAREALLAAIYTSGSYECDAMVDALIAAVRAECNEAGAYRGRREFRNLSRGMSMTPTADEAREALPTHCSVCGRRILTDRTTGKCWKHR